MKRIHLFLLAVSMFLVSVLAFADSPGPTLNPTRAYPASCVGFPLPLPTGPTWSARVTVPTINAIGQQVGTEVVNYSFWRTPCNGGKAALIGLFYRDQALQNTTPAPEFGAIFGSQGGIQNAPLRLAAEPNTYASFIAGGIAIGLAQAFVFENNPAVSFDYSQSLSITMLGLPNVSGTIPAYDSTQYASATLPMQISGYQSGNFSDPSGGQGIQIEVAETNTPGQRALVLAWYTYDATGTSYWLFNSTTFNVGARSVSLPLGYFGGGGFAGAAGNVSAAAWGNVTLSFSDCNHMTLTYQSLSGLPAGVPLGSGTRTFTRVTSINGATCDLP